MWDREGESELYNFYYKAYREEIMRLMCVIMHVYVGGEGEVRERGDLSWISSPSPYLAGVKWHWHRPIHTNTWALQIGWGPAFRQAINMAWY